MLKDEHIEIEESRNFRVVIKEAELVNATNDFVYNFFVGKLNRPVDRDDIDEKTELSLLKKNDPFVDLILAQYCLFPATLKQIFKRAEIEDNHPLKLACLNNKSLVGVLESTKLPTVLFKNVSDNDEDEKSGKSEKTWVSNLSTIEITALFSNETISDHFLGDILDEDNELWDGLSENQRMWIVSSLTGNKRITTEYDGPMDGWMEFSHNRVFWQIWNLAKHVPVNEQWGWILADLFNRVLPHVCDFNSQEVVMRWNICDETAEMAVSKKQKRQLGVYELVRFGIYRTMILNGNGQLQRSYLVSEDIALRACAYANLESIGEMDIQNAYERDRFIALEFLMENSRIWKTENLREIINRLCWDADASDSSSSWSLWYPNLFIRQKDIAEKEHPSWFSSKREESSEADE